MAVTRANVEATKAFIRARVGNPYVYGGALSATNVRQGTDCSEVWQSVLEMVHGRWVQGRQAEGATTESYRYIPVGGVGPFGTIRVAHPQDIPADAAAKLAFHHEGNGGASSHMWGELDGMLIESAGSKGLVTNGRAMTIDNTYGNAWAYLPGPIVEDGTPPPPLGMGSVGPEVVALQQKLNTEGAGLDVDGEYGPLTDAAVKAWDLRTKYAKLVLAEGQRRGITPRGIIITFSVPFVESGWKMYANSSVPESMSIPHDAVGSDHDSVGLFQQRCPMWGPAHVLMDPTLSAGLFYDRLVKHPAYKNESVRPGDVAADIQNPAAEYRYRYQERIGHATALYNRLINEKEEDDFLSALTPDEQKEVLFLLRIQAKNQFPSRSGFRKLNSTFTETVAGYGLNTDGSQHVHLTIELARLGDPESIQLLGEIAGALGDPRYPDRQSDARRAALVLQDLETNHRQVLENYLAQKGARP